jgi:arylsulfatase A-like enzyme
MQWKGKIPEGKVFKEPVSSLDIVPTVLSSAGIEIKSEDNFDGVNLLPYIKGEKSGPPHEVLYWRFHNNRAILMDNWKLIKGAKQENWELYNLSEDIGETKNLAEKMPEKVKEMEKLWEEWNTQLQPPKWFRQDASTKKLKNILKE